MGILREVDVDVIFLLTALGRAIGAVEVTVPFVIVA
jgi:hypothetical protein